MIAVLASSTGALLAWAPTAAALPAPPAQSVVRELATWDAPPPAPYVWDPATIDWVVPADAPPLLSQREFLARWRAAGLAAALRLVFRLEVQDSEQGAAAREWLTEFRTARGIDPTDPDTVANTDAVLALAQAAGVITAAEATAGRAVVLAPH